jgi:uncharacterized lipoprotein YddW (UPF0748 family)
MKLIKSYNRLIFLAAALCGMVMSQPVSSQNVTDSLNLHAVHNYHDAITEPGREFRGAWIHTVGNGEYKNMTTAQMKQHFISLLDSLKSVNINAVIFQVRPQADAFYKSKLEPWSRYITGQQGVAPKPAWDPLEFMVKECHKRGMELHAWFNPYRVASNEQQIKTLAKTHLYYKKPYLFVKYGRLLVFDPGEPEAREWIIKVISDVVKRYDIDAVHFDDYFYPYKDYDKAGNELPFPDSLSFAKYAEKDGFTAEQRNDWRRNNVTLLVKDLDSVIKAIKPWVKFGISPFGVWRNIANDPTGSQTQAGVQNYDDLYADIKLWVKNNWIDYNVPQLYWDIGHPKADFETLINWWSQNNYGENLYIGEDIAQTVKVKSRKVSGEFENQLPRKMELVRANPNVHGNVWWPGYTIPDNPNGFTDSLRKYQAHIALMPPYKHIDTLAPAPIEKVSASRSGGKLKISWKAHHTADEMQRAVYFCVYLNDDIYPSVITQNLFYEIEQDGGNSNTAAAGKTSRPVEKIRITALDRLQNESFEKILIIK